jgi:SNF2-related domain
MYTPGTLVRSRSREWVVLPESEDDFLIVRPLGGTDNEIAGIDTRLEAVEPATFALPDPTQLGDHRSCRILRDAIRLGFRSSAGPFRSLGKIAVQPRAYQYVPLLMALRQETVRLLIADDVGIGKTVEALMIAKELLERGEVHRMAVLCPPHLAEQWKKELFDKFHINAELILASTARRLDKYCGNRSVFDVFPFVVVSLDYIKSENRRDEFIRSCPELVIVDEAHTCTALGVQGNKGTRQQRHEVIRKLAANQDRHMLFVTATPHSGNEQGFRSLLQLLNADFEKLPDDLSGDENRKNRENLAKHFVQRRRKDIEEYLANDAAFPTRLEREETYKLEKSDYRQLFERLLDYARGVVRSSEGSRAATNRYSDQQHHTGHCSRVPRENLARVSDELLHASAVNEFGSWETALQYAGVSTHDVGRCRDLTPERIKFRLRRLCATGYDLGAMVNRSRDRALYDATIRHFGSWREALTAAGINLANVTRHRPKNLDRDAMLLWIRNRKEAGQSITFSEVCLENRDYALAIKREFRSWARALKAAFPATESSAD